jgi:integrase
MKMSIRKRVWTTPRGVQREAHIVDYKAWNPQRRAWQRKHKTFARKKDAQAWLADNSKAIKEKVFVHDRDSPTISAMATLWIEAVTRGRGNRGPAEASTLRQYNYQVNTHIVPSHIGEMKICDLTKADVEDWRNDLLRRISRSLARNALGALKGILSEAISREKATINVAASVKIGRSKEERRKVVVPEIAEVKAILAACDRLAVPGRAGRPWRRYRVMFSLGIHTGMRIGEIRGLPWTALDLAVGQVHVRQQADENNKIKEYTKSDAGRRTIPLPADLVRLLREWKIEAGGNALVFATKSGRPDPASNILRRGWFPLQVLAGVCDPVTDENGNVSRDEDGRPKVEHRHNFHRLRHFHASMLIADGANPLEVSKEIGHSDVGFTLSVYGHLFQDEDANKRRQERSERLAASLGR